MPLFVSPSDFTSISRGVLSGRGEFAAAAAAFLTGNSGTTGFAGPTEACPRGSSAARSLTYLWWHGLEGIKGRARSMSQVVVVNRRQVGFALYSSYPNSERELLLSTAMERIVSLFFPPFSTISSPPTPPARFELTFFRALFVPA